MPNRLVYSLPLRVLVEDIGERALKYGKKAGVTLSIHHGKHFEDPLFRRDLIVTTIDQTVGAYACTPLSFSLKHGAIPAGAVATSFLVFDEIQLFVPELGLQAALVLAKHSLETGFPFVIMSATLSRKFVDRFCDEVSSMGQIELIEAKEEEIPSRLNRKVKLVYKKEKLKPEDIENAFLRHSEKIIVICNTVGRAQELFKSLRVNDKILLHSRFLESDRRVLETKVKKIFGKNGKGKGVLVTTQIIEAGIDLSAPLILSEIAPADSLVQRAGRCARWGGEGEFWIYEVEKERPYLKDLIEKTRKELEDLQGEILTWDVEKVFVEKALENLIEEKWLSIDARANVIAILSEASFTGDRNLASRAVRDEFQSEISLHRDPNSLGKDILRLERIKVPFWLFKHWAEKYQFQIWEVGERNIIDDKMEIRWQAFPIADPEELLPFKYYIVSPEQLGYSEELGLLPGESGKDFPLREASELWSFGEFEYKEESWFSHAKRIEEQGKRLLEASSFELSKLAKALGMTKKKLENLILIIMKLHDLGKLNKRWQEKAGWNGHVPLAHSEKKGIKFPPHATISAYAISKWAYENYKSKKIFEALILAIAHHHSLRSFEYPKYEFIEEWEKILKESNIESAIIKTIYSKASGSHLPKRMPEFNNVLVYRMYVFISRLIKFADWMAVGGEDALVCFEEWYANV